MSNRLAQETSPYLLQHADNPVDWYPWGEEAFKKAIKENKPIFLSVGYSTCHWCHVMAHESFEDQAIAELLNRDFVPIKVDREELPDVDAYYMTALQSITGQGGWPMSLFLTPDGKPFFGGSYFPPHPSRGMPGFAQVLTAVTAAWRDRQAETLRSAQVLQGHLRQIYQSVAEPLPADIHRQALSGFSNAFDSEAGGFGTAPKFPRVPELNYLLEQAWLGEKEAWRMLEVTLTHLARGGIRDWVGGGFHRYATDRYWQTPHFEKTLYDNAQLASVYLGTFATSKNPLFAEVARDCLDYILRELRLPEGAFASGQDADSPGGEGFYYTWDYDNLGPDLAQIFGASPQGNFAGRNILVPPAGPRTPELVQIQAELYRRRSQRPAPARDEKILADWNGLAVLALARGARILGEVRYLSAAQQCADFIFRRMLEKGVVRHCYRGRLRPEAYLSDHIYLGLGLLELHWADGDLRWLELARGLAEVASALFLAPEGGFFTGTASWGQVRPLESADGPTPSGNGAAAALLFRLAQLVPESNFYDLGEATLRRFGGAVARYPLAYTSLLSADLLRTRGSALAILEPAPEIVQAARGQYLPLTSLAMGLPGAHVLLQGREPGSAHLCVRGACRLPVSDWAGLKSELALIYQNTGLE